MKPRSDLCWQCQQNSTAIMRTANLSDSEKSATIESALEHLRIVKQERTLYKSICDECKESVRAHFVHDGQFSPPPLAACTPSNPQRMSMNPFMSTGHLTPPDFTTMLRTDLYIIHACRTLSLLQLQNDSISYNMQSLCTIPLVS